MPHPCVLRIPPARASLALVATTRQTRDPPGRANTSQTIDVLANELQRIRAPGVACRLVLAHMIRQQWKFFGLLLGSAFRLSLPMIGSAPMLLNTLRENPAQLLSANRDLQSLNHLVLPIGYESDDDDVIVVRRVQEGQNCNPLIATIAISSIQRSTFFRANPTSYGGRLFGGNLRAKLVAFACK